MNKLRKNLQIAYLVIGALAACEFIFVRGMFTWIIAVAAVCLMGLVNLIAAVKERDLSGALLYLLCSVGLCMGYFALA